MVGASCILMDREPTGPSMAKPFHPRLSAQSIDLYCEFQQLVLGRLRYIWPSWRPAGIASVTCWISREGHAKNCNALLTNSRILDGNSSILVIDSIITIFGIIMIISIVITILITITMTISITILVNTKLRLQPVAGSLPLLRMPDHLHFHKYHNGIVMVAPAAAAEG